MITTNAPRDWKELQEEAGSILRECGFKVASTGRLAFGAVAAFVTLRATSDLSSAPPPKPFSEIRHHILAIAAGDDRIFPLAFQKRQAEKLTSAKLELAVYDGAEHLILNTQPLLVVPRLAEWLGRRVEGAASG